MLGGTGQIGRAVARRLAEAGWEVTVAGRDRAHVPAELEESGVRFVRVDRERDDELRTAIGGGTDVLVDVIPYTEQDARQLLSLASAFGSLVAISSASVYRDDAGRTLDEATSAEGPRATRSRSRRISRPSSPGARRTRLARWQWSSSCSAPTAWLRP